MSVYSLLDYSQSPVECLNSVPHLAHAAKDLATSLFGLKRRSLSRLSSESLGLDAQRGLAGGRQQRHRS